MAKARHFMSSSTKSRPSITSKISSRLRRFVSDHYLAVTFFVSLTVATTLALFVFDKARSTQAEVNEVRKAFTLALIVLTIGLLWTWPRWFLAKLNSIIRDAIGTLGGSDDRSDIDFKKRIGSVFGLELVSNISTYETYCKNEYVLDMQKHHLAWLMLAVSGAITVVAALIVIFSPVKGNEKWIEAIGVTVPALVTGVLLKIWLETRENLNKTRQRTDTIYRQRIRLLLLVANHVKTPNASWADSIELNRQLLDYINLSEHADGQGPVVPPLISPIADGA